MNLPGTPETFFSENLTEVKQTTSELSFCCRDIGPDCPFESTGTTEQRFQKKFVNHAEFSHDLPFLSADIFLKIRKALKIITVLLFLSLMLIVGLPAEW